MNTSHFARPTLRLIPWLLPALLLSACAGDISPDAEPDPGTDTPAGPGGPQATFTRHDGGYYQAQIDASGSDWIYIDLDSQTQVYPADPADSAIWDIAYRGTEIKLNGGVSGTPPSGVDAAVYGDKVAVDQAYPFDTVVAAPPETAVVYRADARRGLLGLLGTDYAMNTYPVADNAPDRVSGAGDYGWYRRGSTTEGAPISARTNVGYVLRTVDCRYYKLRMTAYTRDDGASGHPRYDFAEIPGGECAGGGDIAPMGRAQFDTGSAATQVTLDASDEQAWVYLDLVGATQVVPTNPANDAAGWDIAWKRTDIKLNGGSSGTGTVALHDIGGDDWEMRTGVPADVEWHTDAAALAFLTYPPRDIGGECTFGADGDYGWHYYSGFCDKGNGIHHISPRDVVYVIRAHDGTRWKLRILGYYGDDGAAAHPRFEYAPLAP